MKTKIVALRSNTFTYPIRKGTPINKYGVEANNGTAIGIIADNIKDAVSVATIITAGEVDLAYMQGCYGSSYSDEALKAMDGISFLDEDGTRVPNVYGQHTLPAATTTKLGGVKKAANVEAVTPAEEEPTELETKVNAILTALKAAGIMVADS